MKEAMLYEFLESQSVRCNLCSHRCIIAEGKKGVCMVRENRAGKLYTHVYGNLIAAHVDPIEKKPLYHFYPGSQSFSIATPGCNFQCRWCQNSDISQLPRSYAVPMMEEYPPEDIVRKAQAGNCLSISYTYTEPTIFFEYAYEIAVLAHKQQIRNVFVSNGYMTSEMLEMMHPHLDAINVDLKSFREDVYHRYIGGGLKPVLDNLRKIKSLGIWLEVTTLVIPGVNDDPDELKEVADFIHKDLGKETPWHISRFHPDYKMNGTESTPLDILIRAKEIGEARGLEYVYLGNVGGDSNTYCPRCGELIIRRVGYRIVEDFSMESTCPKCSHGISGVGLGSR